jgi:hypothetical protein
MYSVSTGPQTFQIKGVKWLEVAVSAFVVQIHSIRANTRIKIRNGWWELDHILKTRSIEKSGSAYCKYLDWQQRAWSPYWCPLA